MAITAHISCEEGEDITLNESPASGQTPTSISGWTITFTLSADTDDATAALVTKTIGSGITIVSASAGTFTIALTSADTNQTPGKYVYDVRRTNAGFETVLTKGTLIINPGVRL